MNGTSDQSTRISLNNNGGKSYRGHYNPLAVSHPKSQRVLSLYVEFYHIIKMFCSSLTLSSGAHAYLLGCKVGLDHPKNSVLVHLTRQLDFKSIDRLAATSQLSL